MSVVDDARTYWYRIRCAKFARTLKRMENAKSRAFRGPEHGSLTLARKSADSDYPVKR
jgi:hypothetical protein